jgi:hypothetical protein
MSSWTADPPEAFLKPPRPSGPRQIVEHRAVEEEHRIDWHGLALSWGTINRVGRGT